MERLRSLALPAAICVAFAGACKDAPLEPRAPNQSQPSASPRPIRTQTFSGQAADSVTELLEQAWSRSDRSPATHSRLDWRLRNNVPAHVRDAALIPSRATRPNALLTDGSYTVTPQVLSHTESFHFGHHDQYSTVASAVNGDMTFIGQEGEIDLASLSITPNAGGTSSFTNGQIALGPGELINCSDVTLATCTTRHLGGVFTVSNAPDCSANASGTVAYWSAVAKTTFGVAWSTTPPSSGGTSMTSVSTSAPITATASQCSSDSTSGGQLSSDSTTTAGTGTVGPPPSPTGPNVPTAPPPATSPESGSGGGFYCQQTDLYSVYGGTRTLLSTVIDCYPDT